MKLAIALIRDSFSAGSIASIAICNEDSALMHLRSITGDIDEIDVRLYQVEEETPTCQFSEGFICNDGRLEIKGGKPYGYEYLCNLTKQQ